MDRVQRFHRNSGVDQHSVQCRADMQEEAEHSIAADASSLESYSHLERSCSKSLLDSTGCNLKLGVDMRTNGHFPTHSSKQINKKICILEAEELSFETSNPLDDAWLLERCDGDSALVHEVLLTFCAQGLVHINAMHQSKVDGDIMATLFHVVSFDICDAKHPSPDPALFYSSKAVPPTYSLN